MAFACLLSSVGGALGLAHAQAPIMGPVISAPVRPDVMDRDLRTLPLAKSWKPGDPSREVPLRELLPPEGGVDTSAQVLGAEDVQDVAALRLDDRLSVTPAEFSMPHPNFEGITRAQGGGFRPPDTQDDVGPHHYIQVVNVAFAIFDKQGMLLAGPTAINQLWAAQNFGGPCQNTNDGDPIVNYDHLADRWLITQFTLVNDGNNQCIAISRGPNPVTDGWYLYQFQLPAANDYPKIGVWPDAYYMGSQRGFFGSGLDL